MVIGGPLCLPEDSKREPLERSDTWNWSKKTNFECEYILCFRRSPVVFFLSLLALESLLIISSNEIKRHFLLGRKVMTNLDSIFKSRDITLPTKVHLVKAMVFPVVMYGCESWTVKKAECRRIDAFELLVLEKTLASPLDCKEIQPVHSKGDQSWVFFGRIDAKAETPILWPPHAKS